MRTKAWVFLLESVLFLAACEAPMHHETATSSQPPSSSGDGTPATPGGSSGDPGSSSSSSSSSSSGSSGMPPAQGPQFDAVPLTLTVAGVQRTATAAVPKPYDPNRAYPLVVALHPDMEDGNVFRTKLNLEASVRDRAIVVYPDGQGATWNLYAPTETNADDAFIAALVQNASQQWHVDTSRVYGTGFSSGAFMVSQLACRKPTLFKAISVHSGGAPAEPQDPNASSWPNGYAQCPNQTSGVAALVIHGTSDDVVDYQSGVYAASYWAYVDGCTDAMTASSPAPCQEHAGCPAQKRVMFCPVQGLKHEIWGDAGKTIAAFFLGS